jgi:hypothetical protein
MIRFPTLVLGATVGAAALGLSATASAGVRFGVDVAVPVPAVVAPAPVVVDYRPVAPYYYGPHFYAGGALLPPLLGSGTRLPALRLARGVLRTRLAPLTKTA